ncbi:TOMM precursor leader peptide-binding protein [Streptomyces sp. JJ66]|uniref:TOMM precursor leader peptide-binding protein n=1 Tax=Streptomyces sp. JJ66 TaxID=2803843 RepID=UPI001C58EE87|nr:TOMM precursor leader peptide-binding protein [Streptomyces sp. JJ66]MBW1602487.1 TOMM precursor leader peptide-binding protein [Streptomyces sp. JJ66]
MTERIRQSDEARRVGFRHHLRVDVVPGDGVYLLSEQGVTVLHGAEVQHLAPLLDGSRTLPELLREAQAFDPALDAGRIVADLARAGLIGYRPARAGSPQERAAAAYWELAGLDGPSVSQTLSRSPVRIVSIGRVDPGQARAACAASGLTVAAPGHLGSGPADGALSLVLCDDYLAPRLAAVDSWHRARRQPWLLAAPGAASPWIGPVFRPGEGPCWNCLAHRLRAHRRSEVPLQQALALDGPVPRPAASLPAGLWLGLQGAVLEAAKWLAGMRAASHEVVTVLDTGTLRNTAHPVTRRPQCAACGDPGLVATGAARPFVPVSRPKAGGAGSNDRSLSTAQMRERYGHLIDPVLGIVSSVRRDERLPAGFHSFHSGQNLAFGSRTLAEVRGSLRSQSGGKGVTAEEAEIGALCEAVERYSATRQGDELVVRETYDGLGDSAVHPNACQLFAERQFTERTRWNARHSAFQRVPAPFAAHRPAEWTPMWSLTAGTHRLLPTSMLYFPGTSPPDPDGVLADSNGNAAGSSPEDAVVQGFLELVERDAVALWWYNRTRHPAVDLDAFDQPWLTELRERYARLRRDLWVLDLTSDFGIPVMAALSRRTDKPAEDITFGFGAHFDPRLALRRAVTEMSQLLGPVAGVGAGPPGTPARYPDADRELLDWWTRATLANQPYLRPDPAQSARAPGNWAYTPRADLRADVAAVERLVSARGMELLVLDQTRPDIGLPVVKVVVPGLRHFWARFAEGRLFDVPVRLGWLDRPTPYPELNPIPLFA